MMKRITVLLFLGAINTSYATCIEVDSIYKVRVIAAGSLKETAQGLTVIDAAYKKVFIPSEEDCFPSNHPSFIGIDRIAFQPIGALTDDSRNRSSQVAYYLPKPLPKHANISISYNGKSPKVRVTVAGKSVAFGKLVKTRFEPK